MTRIRNLASATALALALSIAGGCASLSSLAGEPASAVPDLPESPATQADGSLDWAEPAPDALPSTDWVADFGNAQLSELVARGVDTNPQIRRALAQFDASLAQRRISRADLYPTLGLDGSATRNEGGAGFFAGSTNYSLGFGGSWEADLFGRIRASIDSSEASVRATAADVAGLRVSIAGQATTTWLNAIEADLLVDLSRRNIEAQERILRLTQRRFEAGLGGASDVRLARSQLADFEALLETRQQNRDAVIRNLQALLRMYPDASLDIPEALPILPALEGAGGPAWVLTRRPDLLSAEASIARAGFDVDVARRNLLPQLSFRFGVSEETVVRDQTDPTTGETVTIGSLGDIFDLQDIAYSITTQLTAPLFQGGRLRAQVEAQRATLQAEVETYVQTALNAFTEVENALDAENRLARREAALRISLDEARAAEDRLRRRYVEGLATILQLLDAQTRRLNAEGQLISAQAARLTNRVQLHVALGGGRFGDLMPIPEAEKPLNLPDIDLPLLGRVAPDTENELG